MSLISLVAVCTLLGSALGSKIAGGAESRTFRWLLYFLSGVVQLHLVLLVLDALGVRWGPAVVVVVLVVLYFLVRFICRGRRTSPRRMAIGWGDVLAFVPWAGFAYLAFRERITMPDFVYQWGIKGLRYYLEGGIDVEFLAQPWNRWVHPEYPNLLPELYALTAAVGGGFREPEILLWSAVFFAGLLIAAREALGSWEAGSSGSNDVRHLVLSVLAFALASFGIGHLMAGASDWVVALALLASLPVMLAEPDRRSDRQIGVLAALASAAKLEGMVLAVLLVVAQIVRRARRGRLPLSSLGWITLPSAFGVALWLRTVWQHDLLPPSAFDGVDLSRLPVVLSALADPGPMRFWHGAALVLGLLPLLLASPALRPLAAICAGLLGVYLFVYLSAPVDTAHYVRSSAPRLVLHVLPAVFAGVGLLLLTWMGRRGPGRQVTPDTPEGGEASAEEIYDSAVPSRPFDDEFRDLLSRLDLVWLWSRRTIKLRYKRSVLGVLWTFLEPLAILTILTVVFSSIFRFEIPNYPVYVLSGWVLWDFFSKSTTAMVQEVGDGWRLSSSVRLTRSVFLASSVVTHLFHWLLALLLVIAVLLVLGHPITWSLLGLLPAMAVTAVFALGVGLVVSTVTAFFHDFSLMYQVVLTIWLYATPLIYPLEIVPEKMQPLFLLNPMTHLLALVRGPIYHGAVPGASAWFSAMAISLACFAGGWWLFTSLRGPLAARGGT